MENIVGTSLTFLTTFGSGKSIMAVDVIVTLLLVILNGFFVAAEFAIVKVRS